MNDKMTTNSQLSTTKPKKKQNKTGDHMECYQRGSGGGERGKRYREQQEA